VRCAPTLPPSRRARAPAREAARKIKSGNGDETPAPSLPRFTLLTNGRSFMVNDVIGEILSISQISLAESLASRGQLKTTGGAGKLVCRCETSLVSQVALEDSRVLTLERSNRGLPRRSSEFGNLGQSLRNRKRRRQGGEMRADGIGRGRLERRIEPAHRSLDKAAHLVGPAEQRPPALPFGSDLLGPDHILRKAGARTSFALRGGGRG
jgi:hypothetical protein